MDPQKQPTDRPASPAPAPASPPPQKTKGYGKRPKWQWALIYVVAAVIVYGIIYLLFIHKSGSTGY